MLIKHATGYLAANVVPAVVSFGMVYVFTRELDPSEYGTYALAVSVTLMCQAVFFYWLQVGTSRFIAAALIDQTQDDLMGTVFTSFLACSTAFSLGYAAVISLLPLDESLKPALWLALPLIVCKSLVAVNQAMHRGTLRVARYTILEIIQSTGGMIFAYLYVDLGHLGGAGIILGLLTAAAVALCVDLSRMADLVWQRRFRADLARSLFRFGLPLTAGFALNFILSTSDRLLVEYYLGSEAVGLYSVAYGVTDRALTSVFLAISLAAFPLAVRVLEREGDAAAKVQLNKNATLLLAVTVPSALGFIALIPQLSAVLIGEHFRKLAQEIMPWIALSALMAGLQVHYFDHAFHLGKRTGLFIRSAGPAAIVNIAMNAILLPNIGVVGAAYSTIVAYVLALSGSIIFGRRTFALPFPAGVMARITGAAICMAGVIRVTDFPPTVVGLIGAAISGVAVYAALCMSLDVAGIRRYSLAKIRKTKNG